MYTNRLALRSSGLGSFWLSQSKGNILFGAVLSGSEVEVILGRVRKYITLNLRFDVVARPCMTLIVLGRFHWA